MPESVYIETTVVSYLTARPSRDLVQRAHEQLTRKGGVPGVHASSCTCRRLFCKRPAVAIPCEDGGESLPCTACPFLAPRLKRSGLPPRLVGEGPIPKKADVDAMHIAIAAVHGVDYLVTWNCAHIANAAMRSQIENICRTAGCEPPVLCTPEELMED